MDNSGFAVNTVMLSTGCVGGATPSKFVGKTSVSTLGRVSLTHLCRPDE